MALILSKITAGYSKKIILSDFDAVFEKGQIICIVGPNGCGKSTLLKSIVGVLPTTSGEIFIDQIKNPDRNERAKKISYLAQSRSFSDMTVFDTVLCGRYPHLSFPRVYEKKDREIAFSCIKKMGLEALCDSRLSTLSGGMRQKVYIAMALCQDTDYILLDEPTSFLDISNVFELTSILHELAKSGKSIVCVLHDLVLAFDIADKILVMKDGKNICLDTPDVVVKSGVIKDVFGVGIENAEGFYRYERT